MPETNSEKSCPVCGISLADGQDECPNCGAVIEKPIEVEVPPVQVLANPGGAENVKKKPRSRSTKIDRSKMADLQRMIDEAQELEEAGKISEALIRYRSALAFAREFKAEDPSIATIVQILNSMIKRIKKSQSLPDGAIAETITPIKPEGQRTGLDDEIDREPVLPVLISKKSSGERKPAASPPAIKNPSLSQMDAPRPVSAQGRAGKVPALPVRTSAPASGTRMSVGCILLIIGLAIILLALIILVTR